MTIGLEPLDLPLRFYDKNNNSYVTFDTEGELDRSDQDHNPHIAGLISSDGVYFNCLHDTGNHNLSGFDMLKNVSVLARYKSAENEEPDRLACLSMTIGDGQLTLLCPNIEYPPTQEPLRSLLSPDDDKSFESSRTEFLRHVLRNLDLAVPDDASPHLSSHPRPLLLTFPRHCSSALLSAIRTVFNLWQDMEGVHKDTNDEFQFHSFDTQQELFASLRNNTDAFSNTHLKHIFVYEDGLLSNRQITPFFDLHAYFETLRCSRQGSGLKTSYEGSWGIGETLLYSEVVTSTQTIFDK
jgi:biotin--protein ligase